MQRHPLSERDRLRQLEAAVDWKDGALSIYGRLALEYGLHLSAVEEEWVRWARKHIDGGPEAANADAPEGSEPLRHPEAPAT